MLPPLPSLVAFEAIARRRSFSLAASELHLTPSAVSHQVARLEDFLGVKLFERSSRGVKLSPAGEAYLQRVAGALGAIGAATDDVRQGVRNSLYVHASPSFASLWLMPRIGQFAQAYPGVSLFLSASHLHSDFELGQVDIDIRYGVPAWPQLVVQPIFREAIMPLASPAFIERHQIHTPADLLQVPLIQSTVGVVQWADWFALHHPSKRPERFALRFDRALMALDAAVQGLGVALESTVIGDSYLQAGRLQPVFDPAWAISVQAHFVVYPERHSYRPEVAQFLAWLRMQAGDPAGPANPAV
ncbi:LysR substrate-binding domain-containing protein [Polaromonas sp.]|uniref:LysR substrate-binding domain-containing protein n=1 Tax=Polaromonas sp. TaxID=1869339 RepID=UPI00286B9149|nr:LysR substrate-binding domain-containing protein [Polaromonas sp.]